MFPGELLEVAFEKIGIILRQPPYATFSNYKDRNPLSTAVEFWALDC